MRTLLLGPNVPKRGNALSRAMGRVALWLMRWRMVGEVPDRNQFVLIGAPHSSNWDFAVGMGAMFALGIRISFLVKKAAYVIGLKSIIDWLGGLPVDRKASHGVVEGIAHRFKDGKALILALAPEGTRKRVSRWREGFYHIAHEAGVPIQVVGFDNERRELNFGPFLEPSGDLNADLQRMRDWCARFKRRDELG